MVDMYRCGIKGKKDAKIHYYVMPHTPGNTTANWRRQFYGDIAHGVKVLNLFEFRPVQAAYTENHCSDPAMYQEVRTSFHELGTFEDIVQDGSVRRPGGAVVQRGRRCLGRLSEVARRRQALAVPLPFVTSSSRWTASSTAMI